MKLLIIGDRQHGKTDVGVMLSKALTVVAHDSSWYACKNIVFPALKDKYSYESPEEAHADRMNHRQEWFELIETYNDEPDRLTRAILSEGSIYVGMRSRMEFEGSRHHFDHVIWVDASERVTAEGSESMKLTKDDADYVLNNNGPLIDLPLELGNLLTWLAYRTPKDENHLLVYGIDPKHHMARGTLGAYIAEQLIHGDDDAVSTQLGSLHGPGTDKLMSPMRMTGQYYQRKGVEEVEGGYFEDSRAMEGYDLTVDKDAGDNLMARARESDEAMDALYGHEVSVGDLVTSTIAAVDPSVFERSFNDLQTRVSDWAAEALSKETDGAKFDLLIDPLRAMVEDLQCPEDFAEAMLFLMQGMKESGYSMHEDILPAAYRQIETLKSRTYYTDQHGDLQYVSNP